MQTEIHMQQTDAWTWKVTVIDTINDRKDFFFWIPGDHDSNESGLLTEVRRAEARLRNRATSDYANHD